MLKAVSPPDALRRLRIRAWRGGILILGMMIVCASMAHAASSSDDDTVFEITPGCSIKRIKTSIHYEEKNRSSAKWFDVKDRYAKNKHALSEFISLRYNLNQKSFLLLDYTEDSLDTNVAGYERIKIIFFPVTIGLRIPLSLNAHRIKLMYGRQLIAGDNFDAGWMLGAQLVDLKGEITYPGGLKEDEHVLAPLPEAGLYAGYRFSEKLRCRLMANYFPITSVHVGDLVIDGSITEADLTMEYSLAKQISSGLTYRYSKVRMDIDADDYRANGSYSTYGPGLFIKATF